MHAYSGDDRHRTAALGVMAVLAVAIAIGVNWVFSHATAVPPWLMSAPAVAGVFGLLYLLMDQYAWRWTITRRLGLTDIPIVDGEYRGRLVSTYEGVELPVRVVVDQTWTKVAIRFEVVEPVSSTSYSVTAGLNSAGRRSARLTYTYRNQPRPGIADSDLRDHDGTAELVIDTDGGSASGRYYNYRGRQGTLELLRD